MSPAAMKKMTDEATGEASYRKPRKKCSPAQVRPPLMPLIDVMFTLLMFFLVAAKVRVPEGMIPANLPELGTAPGPGPTGKIFVKIVPVGAYSRDVRFQINEKDLASAPDLYLFLTRVKKELGPDVPIILKPDPNVRWVYVVDAFNQAVRLSFTKVGFAPIGSPG